MSFSPNERTLTIASTSVTWKQRQFIFLMTHCCQKQRIYTIIMFFFLSDRCNGNISHSNRPKNSSLYHFLFLRMKWHDNFLRLCSCIHLINIILSCINWHIYKENIDTVVFNLRVQFYWNILVYNRYLKYSNIYKYFYRNAICFPSYPYHKYIFQYLPEATSIRSSA